MKIPGEVAPGEAISAKAFNELVRYVRSLHLRGGPGTRVSRSAVGTTVSASAKAAGGSSKSSSLVHPFMISDASASGAAFCQVRFGTINDVTPTGIATNLSLTSAAVWRVYLNATLNDAGAITAAAVTAATGAQPADTRTHAYVTLGLVTVVSGLSVSQIDQAVTHSLRFCASGRTGSVDGTYNFWGV